MARRKSKKVTLSNMIDEGKKPALVLCGMFLGNRIGKLLDKNVTPTVSGLLGLDGANSKLVKPLILTAAGLATSQTAKDENIKMIGWGVAGYGIADAAKDLLKVDLLSGVDEEDYYAIQGTQPIPGIGSSDDELPNLPILNGDDYEDDNVDVSGIEEDLNKETDFIE
jgi:hypothetical protein